jgi:hypothetical protein
MFGSLMQQAMQGAQGGGAGGQSSGGTPGGAGQGSAGMGSAGVVGQPPSREDAVPDQPAAQDPAEREERDTPHQAEREPLHHAETDAAGPSERQHNAGPAPVTPPAHPRETGEDLGRRL